MHSHAVQNIVLCVEQHYCKTFGSQVKITEVREFVAVCFGLSKRRLGSPMKQSTGHLLALEIAFWMAGERKTEAVGWGSKLSPRTLQIIFSPPLLQQQD